MSDIEKALNLEVLRASFLDHTRAAYRLLPDLVRPRILDLGCGRGLPTLEISQLSDGDIVAIDTDSAALAYLQARIEEADLSRQINVVHVSIYETGFPDGLFDVIWEEGVMHLLDSSRSLPECRRLLKPGGFLVMHEDVTWFGSVQNPLRGFQNNGPPSRLNSGGRIPEN
ncbi:MAG: class I SAM-dependent methyltransferase [Polyangiaceae bacterium]|jgi:SAM-dependent methyltransferase|nr:class I SAM-dependent methyltransferase [Polyangiaceae bacterium]